MNGIIHNCSHPNDNDIHFRISEEQIFKDIFFYLETLFNMIKPQKLFFLAVDGVAVSLISPKLTISTEFYFLTASGKDEPATWETFPFS